MRIHPPINFILPLFILYNSPPECDGRFRTVPLDYMDSELPPPPEFPATKFRAESFLAGKTSPKLLKQFAGVLYDYLKGVSHPNPDSYDAAESSENSKARNLELQQDAFEKTTLFDLEKRLEFGEDGAGREVEVFSVAPSISDPRVPVSSVLFTSTPVTPVLVNQISVKQVTVSSVNVNPLPYFLKTGNQGYVPNYQSWPFHPPPQLPSFIIPPPPRIREEPRRRPPYPATTIPPPALPNRVLNFKPSLFRQNPDDFVIRPPPLLADSYAVRPDRRSESAPEGYPTAHSVPFPLTGGYPFIPGEILKTCVTQPDGGCFVEQGFLP